MVEKVINLLKREERFKDRIDHIEVLPPKSAIYGKIDNLPSNIQNYLDKKGIKLYEHQCQSIEHIRNSKNIIITTPTASGKTLAFNIPILEKLNADEKATALYIYPAKALENDQLKTLKELEKECNIKTNPNIYDGDTDKSKRPWIRENSRIILTNPHELHLVIPWNYKWAKFFNNLKFVVIDEAHLYRGVFGSNVAYLIRRLRRICNYYGSNPQFILSSATLANPLEFSERLTGLPFELISEDGSPQGTKNFIFYNPYYGGSDEISVHQETKDLFLFFIVNGLQTLCFTISRRMAELTAKWAKTDIDKEHSEYTNRIAAYRAGYLAEERRQIEKELKNEELFGVTTTNALELGINIGSLDAVIISGYPGTMMSTWQQAGRAGRGIEDSLVTLVAFKNPLDQYLMKNPKLFFDKPHEHAIINLNNPYILSNHILCAASEIPINEEEFKEYFGDNREEFLDQLKKSGLIVETFDGWRYSKNDSIALKVSLNNVSSDNFKVMVGEKLLEKLDQQQAYREAHEGAILINKSESYIIEELDIKNSIIHAKKWDIEHHTEALKSTDIRIINKIKNKNIGDLILSFGDLEISEKYYKYRRMLYDKKVGEESLDLPPINFRTKGFWFTLPADYKEQFKLTITKDKGYEGGLHGAEHAIIAMTPFHVMCDQFDLGGLSTPYHQDTQNATIFVYDGFAGGIGLTEKAIEMFEEIVNKTYNLVKECGCKNGCPACIYAPNCGNENDPLDKDGTLLILKKMIKMMKSE